MDASPGHVQHYERVLSSDERTKAGRFRFARDEQHFILARGILRTLTGHYLALSPEQVSFHYNQYGRPEIVSPSTTLHFNISHSHELALLAFTHHRELGVDVEFMDERVNYDEVAHATFSPHEAATVSSLSGDAKRQAFFNCWTRKEAYIKARGIGISLDLTRFDVSLIPGEPTALVQNREDSREVSRWRFAALDPAPDYAAALAVEGQHWHARLLQWSFFV